MAQVIKDNLYVIENSVTGNGGKVSSVSANVSDLAASRVVVTDADKNLVSSATTTTEVGYVEGVTSPLQTQINSKEPTLTKGNLTSSGAISLDQTRQVIGGAVAISHVDTAGYKHVPTGGTTGQFLKYGGASGTPVWADHGLTATDVHALSGYGLKNYIAKFNSITEIQMTLIYEDDDGNVGIGTTSPISNLEVKDPTDPGVLTISGGNSISAVGQEFAALQFRSGDLSPLSTNDIVGKISSVAEYANGAYAGMAFYTADNVTSPYLSERVRITNAGNVGIGTTTPAEELHVVGTIRSDDLTASRVVVTDADKSLVSSSITASSLSGFLGNTLVASQTLVDGSATNMFEIGILPGMAIGGKFSYTIQAMSAGSHAQALTGEVILNAAYDGSIVATIFEGEEIFSGAAGTSMTSTFAITAGANKVTISCNANSSLSSPTIAITYKLEMHIAASITEL